MSNAHLLINMEQEKKFVRNKEEKIKIIYSTFIALLKEKSYSDLSTNLIADIAPISLGTIYRYFPEGKAAIAKGYFEHIKDKIIDEEFFRQASEKDLPELFQFLISKHLNIYRENLEAFLAYEQALLSNKELFKNHSISVQEFAKETVTKLRKGIDSYQNIPKERLLKSFLLIYNIIEAITRRHLAIIPMFNSDEELIKFLTKLVIFSIQYS